MGKEKGRVKVVTMYTVTVIVYIVMFEKLDDGNVNGQKEALSTIQWSEKKSASSQKVMVNNINWFK